MVDLSPDSDNLGRAVLVHLTKTRPREHDLTEPIWSKGKESCCDVDNSLKRFWEIEKSGTDRDGRLVLTEEERLALGKKKDSLKYENGRYRVAVP
ncbi:hypothetical protein pdam_00001474 [Pocillopora damicornis]|uniref:Uncharacterized protein n=1 Tax=Pocillopora damicornis TaxID=46731 RepID=A0A3M6V4B4_POCDA|nr:hypothetical protein pdam_00001474 [Pocillopora damicornis]